MHRFFVDKKDIKKDSINITGEDVQHITKVLRLKVDDVIVLCDGEGVDYYAAIKDMDKHMVKTEILKKEYSNTEPMLKVVLYQGIPKGPKMDIIIQKCTELGVNRIVPVVNMRNVVKLSYEQDIRKKTQRWQRIAIEAAKQSRRGIIPKIERPKEFKEALEDALNLDLAIMPYEMDHNNPLKDAIRGKNVKEIGIFIGPEGGYESSEITEALDKGIITVTLGPRILRTETAGLAVLSCLMYEFDEMK